MASETYIVCKKITVNPTESNPQIIGGLYHFTFYTDPREMQDFLERCKISHDINDIYMSCFEPMLKLIRQLELKDFIIEYENDFAGIPDESGFTIPVVNGKIVNKFICDESNNSLSNCKRAYKAIGVDYPY